ncbi:MAG: methyltransferase domain-containing protein [Pseudomonadota bacterium]
MSVTPGVMSRYSAAAKTPQADLCCPIDYDQRLLKLLPQEIIEKDYGCGDPSRYVREGDVVLDLGSGGGKICYMAAQIVGSTGKVIGIDMNDDMLGLARKYQAEMARKLGGDRVRFVKGYIQDLALDLEAAEANQAQQKISQPLIADASVDLVISNCVLNLVGEADRSQMIREIARVLKPAGRVAISDIVSDEAVPQELKQDKDLWSGCIAGAFQEQEFLKAFVDAGFLAVGFDKWDAKPWRVVNGIEFRSVTLTATKGVGSSCFDYGHAVIYRGPFSSVTDDEGHVFPRGERMAVCERTYRFLMRGPLKNDFIGITPAVLRDPPSPWCTPAGARRTPTETKAGSYNTECCGGGCC